MSGDRRKGGVVTLPKGVRRVLSRGREYFYFQEGRGTTTPGERVKLPDDPHSPEFWQAISDLKAGTSDPVKVTLNVLFDKFVLWLQPRNDITDETKRKYAKQLDICRPFIGHIAPVKMRPADTREVLDQFIDVPGTGNNLLGALRALSSWGVERGHFDHSITESVKPFRSQEGHRPWKAAQCAAAEQHFTGMLRRAYFLARYTGLRGSDVVRLGPHMIDDGGFRIVPQKTRRHGLEIWCPIDDRLAAEMATWPKELGPYLKQHWGKVYGRKLLDKHFREAREKFPALAGTTFHGLRGTRVVELRQRGANTSQINDQVGMSMEMIAHYSRFSDRKANGKAAVIALRKNAT